MTSHQADIVSAVYAGLPLFGPGDSETNYNSSSVAPVVPDPGRRGLNLETSAAITSEQEQPPPAAVLLSEGDESVSLGVIVAMCLIPFLILVFSAALLTFFKSSPRSQAPTRNSPTPAFWTTTRRPTQKPEDYTPAWSRPFWCTYIVQGQKVGNYKIQGMPRQYCSAFVYGYLQLTSPGQLEDIKPYNDDLRNMKDLAKLNSGGFRDIYLAVGGPSAFMGVIQKTVADDAKRNTFCFHLLNALGAMDLAGVVVHFPADARALVDDTTSTEFALHLRTCLYAHGRNLVFIVPDDTTERQKYFSFLSRPDNNISVIYWTHRTVGKGDASSHCPVDLGLIDNLQKTLSLPQANPAYESLVTLSLAAGQFKLTNPSNPGSMQSAVPDESRSVPYTEVCRAEKMQWKKMLNTNTGCVEIWDGDIWISSLDIASEMHICRTLSTGIVIFDMEYDDYLGTCDGRKNALVAAVARALTMAEKRHCTRSKVHRLFDR